MSGDKLKRLAGLVAQQNRVATEIAGIVERPAEKGHVGEYIASQLFDIELEESATSRAIDGRFRSGALASRTVNVKWYAKREGILDINQGKLPDFYLVLTGPKTSAASSRGTTRDWLIESVYLFDAAGLVERLRSAGLKIGTATSVRASLWEEAEVYPQPRCQQLPLSPDQSSALMWFGSNPGCGGSP